MSSCCASKNTAALWGHPLEAKANGQRESLLYLPAVLNKGFDGAEHPDYLATVDVDPSSPTYSQVIHRLPLGRGDELHHMGWNACSSCLGKLNVSTHTYLVLGAVLSGNVYFVDVKTDPKLPRLHKTITADEISAKAGLGLPHTSHCGPDEIIMSFMGGPKEDGYVGAKNGFLAIDPHSFEVKGRWENPEETDDTNRPNFGYDFWYQPRHNVMVSSEWGEPSAFGGGFNPAHVAEGKYGHFLYFWDWKARKVVQKLDLGVGAIPLEVRFLHDPDATEGYVGCALSSTIVRFFKQADGTWAKEDSIVIPPLQVEGWALPAMPGLITDFVISLDDKYLFLSLWLHGDVRMYDISDRAKPRLVGQVFVGGSVRKGKGVTVTGVIGEKGSSAKSEKVEEEPETDSGDTSTEVPQFETATTFKQPDPLVVKGVEVQGGAQMVQLSLDGKRLYVTTSLFSVWDAQFYPDLVKKGGQLLQLDVDYDNVSGLENGANALKVNEEFIVDFGEEPWGPALCHEMRLPGGDCTSDIWV